MHDDFFIEEPNKKFNFFLNEKKAKKFYKITYVMNNGEKKSYDLEISDNTLKNKKNLTKNLLQREQVENLLKINYELNKKAEELSAELKAKNEEILENQKKIQFLESKVKEQEKRIEEFMNERNLPKEVSEDIGILNQKFAETREMLLSLKDKVSYGDRGLKKLCYLFSVCYSIGNDDMKGLAEQIKYILEGDFDCRMIKPEQNEIFDSHIHEATVYDANCTVIEECCTPGWKYNDKVLVKAVVKIKQETAGEN